MEDKINLEDIVAKGALIIDVRTAGEYDDGHIEGSLNIPLNNIQDAMAWLVKDVPIITVCASGSRSGVAQKLLEAEGYKEVYNGGAWDSLGKMKFGACLIK